MKLHFPLNTSRHVTVISAYVPLLTSSDAAKDAFYEELNALVKDAPLPLPPPPSPHPASDKLILLRDFNARVGPGCNNWKGVLGPHATGKLNSNGFMLLSFCAENDLTVTNTLFHQADKYKTTWMHPRSKRWHLTDYAICRRRDIRDVRITRTMQGAECWTDHRLVGSILSLHFSPTRRKTAKSCRSAFDTEKKTLKQLERSRMFEKDLDDRLTAHGPLSRPPPQRREQFKTLVTESAKTTIGPKKKIDQDWFDENDKRIKELLNDKKKAFIEWQKDTSKGRPRQHFAECRTSGGRRRPTKSKRTLPQRTQKCSSAPSRKSTALPSHAPVRSCQLTAQPCLRKRAVST